MEHQAVVSDIQKFSVHDGPGIRTILFLKGCPLSCQWCANVENIVVKPQLMVYRTRCIGCGRCVRACGRKAVSLRRDGSPELRRDLCCDCGACTEVCAVQAREIKGKIMTALEAKAVLDRDLPFYQNSGGGVTFSGGEPMLYADFIADIAKAYKEQGLTSVVETCGCVPWEKFELAMPWVDLFLYDLKFIDRDKHRQYCGVGNDRILENLKKLCRDARVIIRIPIIPGINDTVQDLDRMIVFLKDLDGRIEGIHCLPYHNMGLAKREALDMAYLLPDVPIPEDAYMEKIKDLFMRNGFQVQIGG